MDPTEPVLTTTLIKAARALLNWDQHRLAEAAQLSRKTVSLIEAADAPPTHPQRIQALKAIEQAFEKSGVMFTFRSKGGGEGVRLRR